MEISIFTFNPFSENTYIIHDDTNECIIIDPGCYNEAENQQLLDYIKSAGLKPQKLILTHAHLDHIFGCNAMYKALGLAPYYHEKEKIVYDSAQSVAQHYGVFMQELPVPAGYISIDDTINFGNTELSIIFTPGHSPGSVCFLHKETKTIIAGDVLFRESIGRTDLPGGDHATLINSIKKELLVLDDDWKVYPGHGPSTTIGYERTHNPFLR